MAAKNRINPLMVLIKKISFSGKINFAYTLRPIYYVSRAVGLFPFTIVHDLDGDVQEARVTLFDFLWFTISICIYLYMPYLHYEVTPWSKVLPVKSVLIVIDVFLMLMGMFYGAIFVIADMCNRFRLIRIMKEFTTFDKEIMRMGVHLDYKKEYRYIRLWYSGTLVFVSILATLTFIFYQITTNKPITLSLMVYFCCYLFQRFVAAIESTTYIVFILCLHRRFDHLNSFLKLRTYLEKNNFVNFPREMSIGHIRFTGRSHSLLTGIMEQLNHCYSLQVMFNIGFSFVFSVLSFYSFYRYILEPTEYFAQSVFFHFHWQIFYLTFAFAVIYVGSVVTSKGRKTSEIVNDIVNNNNDADFSLSWGQVSTQIQGRYPVASCGLFVFDWTLLFTIIGATTTYVTILAQFDTAHGTQSWNKTIT